MMDMQQLGYFLYMEEQENQQKEQHRKVNVEIDNDLVGEKATQNQQED